MPQKYAVLHADAQQLLSGWSAPTGEQDALRRQFLAHLDRHPDAMWRHGPPAHLTASCLVLDAEATRVLLTLHARAGMWLQFGGHLEPGDTSVHAGALREAQEESGTTELQVLPQLVDLDRHALGSGFRRCTEHLDLRFVGRAGPGAQHVVSAESLDVRWWPVDDLPPGTSPDLRRLARAAREHLTG